MKKAQYLVTIARGWDISLVRGVLSRIGKIDDKGCECIPRLVRLRTSWTPQEIMTINGIASVVPAKARVEAATTQTITNDLTSHFHHVKGNIGLVAMSSPDPIDLTATEHTYDYDRSGADVIIYYVDARPSAIAAYEGRFVEIFAGYAGDGPGLHSFTFGPLVATDVGVAKEAPPVRVSVALPDNGFAGSVSVLTAALNAVVADYQADTSDRPAVLNCSLFAAATVGGGDPLEAVVEALVDAGIVIVASAGNASRPNPDGAYGAYPAANSDAIGVGNYLADGQIDPRSNYGSQTEIYAIGGNVSSDALVAISSTTWNIDGAYTRPGNGTSSAAPHVTGALACFLTGYARLRGRDDVLAVKAALLGFARAGAVAGVPEGPTAALHKPGVLGADPLGIPDLWRGAMPVAEVNPGDDEAAEIYANAVAFVNANPDDLFVQAAIAYGGSHLIGVLND